MKINFSDFVKIISKRTGYAQADVKEVLNAVSAQLADNLAAGQDTTAIPGLTVGVTEAKERNGRNPQTGEAIIIPAHKKVRVVVAPRLKNAFK